MVRQFLRDIVLDMPPIGMNGRKHRRKAFVASAVVDLSDGSALRPCAILDISDGGARLKVGNTKGMPARFKLRLSGTGTVVRVCKVVWKTKDEVGVQFLRNVEHMELL
jgi:hypothetical protein